MSAVLRFPLICAALLVLALAGIGQAKADMPVPSAADEARVLELLNKASEPLPRYGVHWGKTPRIASLGNTTLTSKLFEKVKGTQAEQVAGQGLYFSIDAIDSESFGSKFVVLEFPKNQKAIVWEKLSINEQIELIQKAGWSHILNEHKTPGAVSASTYDVAKFFQAPDVRVGKDLGRRGYPILKMLDEDTWYVIKTAVPDIKIHSSESFSKLILGKPYPKHVFELSRHLYISTNDEGIVQAYRKIGNNVVANALQEKVSKVSEWNKILGRRFIDPPHWDLANTKFETPQGSKLRFTEVHLSYGREAFDAWLNAVEHVEENAIKRLPTIDDFKELHGIVADISDARYDSYYRQVLAGIEDASLRRTAAKLLEQKKYTEFEKLLDVKKPLGVLRRSGERFFRTPLASEATSADSALFTKTEFEALEANPYLKVIAKAERGDKIKGAFAYPKGENVEALMQEHFSWLNKSVSELKAKYALESQEYVQAANKVAAEFYYRLVSTHPFWDGNGRSSKLARDWVLNHLGLPAPAYTPVNDMAMSLDKLAEEQIIAMRESRKAGVKHLAMLPSTKTVSLYFVSKSCLEGLAGLSADEADSVKEILSHYPALFGNSP